MSHPHSLLLAAYPLGNGPYDRWELTVEATGEILAAGKAPISEEVVRGACEAYRRKIQEVEVDRVCHKEQLIVWASEIEEVLESGGYLQDDMNYDDRISLQRDLMASIKRIVGGAFNHPERKVSGT